MSDHISVLGPRRPGDPATWRPGDQERPEGDISTSTTSTAVVVVAGGGIAFVVSLLTKLDGTAILLGCIWLVLGGLALTILSGPR